MNTKKLYAFARMTNDKKEYYNKCLNIKNINCLSEEEKKIPCPIKYKTKYTTAFPRLANFHFEDGAHIALDLMEFGNKYIIWVYVCASDGIERTYEFLDEDRFDDGGIEIEVEEVGKTYICVLLENNTKKNRKEYLNKVCKLEK